MWLDPYELLGTLHQTFQCPNAGLLRCGWSSAPAPISTNHSFSALTLGFFDVARLLARRDEVVFQFQCPNAGLLRCGQTGSMSLGESTCFSALTLGFFDVAWLFLGCTHFRVEFQCPNAGLLRCGEPSRCAAPLQPSVSVP